MKAILGFGRFCRLMLCVVVLSSGQAIATAADGWTSLFDGQTLAGWRASENPGGFTVVDGAIAFEGERSHLFYVGPVNNADFKNFEFELEVMTRPQANSGVYFHTAYQERDWPEQGFEAQVANTHRGAGGYVEMKKTGSLYGIRNLYKALVRDNEWFTMRITVRGSRIQIRLNGDLVVDYVEPEGLVLEGRSAGRRLSRGTFALQGHDPESRVFFRNIRVKPLPDDPAFESVAPMPFDEVDARIIRLGAANYPLVDFHTHLKGGLTMQGLRQSMHRTGFNYGVAVNGGLGFAVTNDAGALEFLESMAGEPVFVALQAEGREWMTLFSPELLARFDYVFTDSMTITDHRGRRTRLWIHEEVEIPDTQAFMDHLVDTIVHILDREPIDIYANPTFLPDLIAAEYDALWTPERMQRVIDAARRNGIAIEINSRYRIPSPRFVKLAKQAGLKFTLGTNNVDAQLGRNEYGLRLIEECGLKYEDFWMPKPEGQKPVQTKPWR
jgi:hypothetical protein